MVKRREPHIERVVLEETGNQGSTVGSQGDVVEPRDRVQGEDTTAHVS